MSRRTAMLRFCRGERGVTATEFALVLPALVLLSIGVINLSLMLFTVATLHFTAEDAARWCMVHASGCTSASVSTYASSRYTGIGAAPSFTLTSPATCAGEQVTASATYNLMTGLADLSVPISATACRPFG